MALTFLNPARSYDADHLCVRFMGYDGMKSVPFAVELGALTSSGQEKLIGESDSLAAFDAVRPLVQQVAQDAYANARQTSYLLTVSDFR